MTAARLEGITVLAHDVLDELLVRGAALIAEPVETTWGHFTAFFGDPEGNIHSLFAVLPPASALQASD